MSLQKIAEPSSKVLKPLATQPSSSEVSEAIPRVPWNPFLAVVTVLVIYVVAQLIGYLFTELIGAVLGLFIQGLAANWLNSISGQFVYVIFAEGITIGSVYLFLRHYKTKMGLIGLKRPRTRDFLIGLAVAPVYYLVYFLTVGVVSYLVPSLNVSQKQDVGFNDVHGFAPLLMTFISLVILPPLAEEILVRGYLYSSLRKGLPQVAAVLLTSAIFASAHLPEGGGGGSGLLWIAALDTFVLSLFLILLREKTGSLWSSMTLHAIKNGVAFFALYMTFVHL